MWNTLNGQNNYDERTRVVRITSVWIVLMTNCTHYQSTVYFVPNVVLNIWQSVWKTISTNFLCIMWLFISVDNPKICVKWNKTAWFMVYCKVLDLVSQPETRSLQTHAIHDRVISFQMVCNCLKKVHIRPKRGLVPTQRQQTSLMKKAIIAYVYQ